MSLLKKIFVCLFTFWFISCSNTTKKNSNNFNYRYKSQDSLLLEYYGKAKYDSLLNNNLINIKDSIPFPHIFYFEFLLQDIVNFKTNQSDFILKTQLAFYNENENVVVNNDTLIDFNPEYYMTIDYEGDVNNGDVVISESNFDGVFYFSEQKDSLAQWSKYFEAKMYHNWKMKKYPFDVQKIQFKIISDLDTSLVRFRESKDYPASYLDQLSFPEGFEVSSIKFTEEFVKSSFSTDETLSVANFSIYIKRSGVSLFLKLFLGAFLAFILSISVFYIPREDFDARSQISVGAIFAAVGNKYFVDSSTVSNILTVSDIINNSIILLVIFNVFIMIAQRSNKLDWKWLEVDRNAVFLSSIFMFIVVILTLIIYIIT